MRMPNITPSIFYTIGKYAFFVIGLIGMIRVVDLFTILKSYDVFSSLASVIFNFILAGFFAYLQKQENIKEVDDKDIFKMNEALDKLNLEEE